MSRICVIRKDRKKYSEATGRLSTILKMRSTLPESKERQIIVDKQQFKEFCQKKKFVNSILCEVKVFDCIEQVELAGMKKSTIGVDNNINLEIHYIDFGKTDYYILAKVLMNGEIVYEYPKRIDVRNGVMELSI